VTALPAFSGLEKIEASLSELLLSETARDQMTARLRDLLTALSPASPGADAPDTETIQEASDDAIFDFIDNKLGL
jgi:polyketide synthase 12